MLELAVKMELKDGVARLTMNRPNSRNALHPEMIQTLTSQFLEIAQKEDVRVVVLTGTASVFSAGLDLKYLATLGSDARVVYMRSAFSMFEKLYHLPQATIAAVNGAAVAGGFDLAAFCDIRLCSPNAVFGQPEIKLGVTQFIYPLYTYVGMGRAKELALTGDTITADEAFRIGLVNHVYSEDDLIKEAMELAGRIAARPRAAINASKRAANALPGKSDRDAFQIMGSALDESIGSETHREALAAYFSAVKET